MNTVRIIILICDVILSIGVIILLKNKLSDNDYIEVDGVEGLEEDSTTSNIIEMVSEYRQSFMRQVASAIAQDYIDIDDSILKIDVQRTAVYVATILVTMTVSKHTIFNLTFDWQNQIIYATYTLKVNDNKTISKFSKIKWQYDTIPYVKLHKFTNRCNDICTKTYKLETFERNAFLINSIFNACYKDSDEMHDAIYEVLLNMEYLLANTRGNKIKKKDIVYIYQALLDYLVANDSVELYYSLGYSENDINDYIELRKQIDEKLAKALAETEEEKTGEVSQDEEINN